jgi:hypothetical protein
MNLRRGISMPGKDPMPPNVAHPEMPDSSGDTHPPSSSTPYPVVASREQYVRPEVGREGVIRPFVVTGGGE